MGITKYEHKVTADEVGLSINQILRRNFSFSARFKTKIKYQSLIDLNGICTPGYAMPIEDDLITIRLPDESSNFTPEDIPVNIIFEDCDLLIINKQPGIIVHPTKGHPNHTLANGLMKYMLDTGQTFKVRFANRLDMDTSGIIIACKNANAQKELSSQMSKGTIVKKYYALVDGIIDEDHFTVNLPIGKSPDETPRRCVIDVSNGGKEAISEVRVMERYDNSTLIEVTLHTGRTHQIRVHLSHIGHSIVSDPLYGTLSDLIPRQALHAYYIEFDHPHTGEHLTFKTDIPEDFNEAIKRV